MLKDGVDAILFLSCFMRYLDFVALICNTGQTIVDEFLYYFDDVDLRVRHYNSLCFAMLMWKALCHNQVLCLKEVNMRLNCLLSYFTWLIPLRKTYVKESMWWHMFMLLFDIFNPCYGEGLCCVCDTLSV